MHLITNINVDVPITAGGRKIGKLKATLNNPIGIEPKGGYSASIDYVSVVTEEGEEVEYNVLQADVGRIPISEADFQAIYDSIKATLPSDADMHLRLMTMGYKVVETKMIQEFAELTSSANFDLIP